MKGAVWALTLLVVLFSIASAAPPAPAPSVSAPTPPTPPPPASVTSVPAPATSPKSSVVSKLTSAVNKSKAVTAVVGLKKEKCWKDIKVTKKDAITGKDFLAGGYKRDFSECFKAKMKKNGGVSQDLEYDQDKDGCPSGCFGYAAAYEIQAALKISGVKRRDVSAKHIVSCTNQATAGNNCARGGSHFQAVSETVVNGFCTKSEFGKFAPDFSCKAVTCKKTPLSTTKVYLLPKGNENEMARALDMFGPLIVNFGGRYSDIQKNLTILNYVNINSRAYDTKLTFCKNGKDVHGKSCAATSHKNIVPYSNNDAPKDVCGAAGTPNADMFYHSLVLTSHGRNGERGSFWNVETSWGKGAAANKLTKEVGRIHKFRISRSFKNANIGGISNQALLIVDDATLQAEIEAYAFGKLNRGWIKVNYEDFVAESKAGPAAAWNDKKWLDLDKKALKGHVVGAKSRLRELHDCISVLGGGSRRVGFLQENENDSFDAEQRDDESDRDEVGEENEDQQE